MFEYDERSWYMFLSSSILQPKAEDVVATDPASVYAEAYDVVLNGYELGGGSLRIHTRITRKMFETLGFTKEAQDNLVSC